MSRQWWLDSEIIVIHFVSVEDLPHTHFLHVFEAHRGTATFLRHNSMVVIDIQVFHVTNRAASIAAFLVSFTHLSLQLLAVFESLFELGNALAIHIIAEHV